MKKYLVIVFALALLSLSSCHKTRYCKCTTIINEEVVEVGDGDYYVIEDNRESCADKSKEIDGWGHVTCVEYSESEVNPNAPTWWEELFGLNNNNNNGNNNHGGNGKP